MCTDVVVCIIILESKLDSNWLWSQYRLLCTLKCVFCCVYLHISIYVNTILPPHTQLDLSLSLSLYFSSPAESLIQCVVVYYYTFNIQCIIIRVLSPKVSIIRCMFKISIPLPTSLEPIPANIGREVWYFLDRIASQSQGWRIVTDNHSHLHSHLQVIQLA